MKNENCEKIINETVCNLEMKFFCSIPRLGMGWYLCPNCDKKEYESRFLNKEQMCEMDAQDIFKKVIKELNYCEEKEMVLNNLINKLKNERC
jgi:hypothetical protein